MQKNLIFENDPDFEGIPELLKKLLKSRFLANREYWFNFSERLRTNKNGMMKQLAEIPDGTNVIGQTNFHEEDAIEKWIHIMTFFMRLNIHLNFYTILEEQVFGTMEAAFGKYIARNEAFVTPHDQNPREYKELLNHLLMTTMSYHHMYRMVSDDPEDDKLITYENCVLAINIAPAMSA